MAGLAGISAKVGVGPPLASRAPSMGSPLMKVGPLGRPAPPEGLLLLIRSYWAVKVVRRTAAGGIGGEVAGGGGALAEDVIDERAIERAATMDAGVCQVGEDVDIGAIEGIVLRAATPFWAVLPLNVTKVAFSVPLTAKTAPPKPLPADAL